MIAKKIRSKKNHKTRKRQIADLVDYIRHPHDINPKEKIEHSGDRNFISATHAGQRMEMITLASESVHSKLPVTHWVFSWRENEQPTAAQVDELVDIFLEGMGLTGHQVIYGLHYNTDNYHVHIAVNRMNSDTMKVVDPNHGFDIEAALKIVALVEHRQDWAPEKTPSLLCGTGKLCGGLSINEKQSPRRRRGTLSAPPAKNPRSVSRRSAAIPSSKMQNHGRNCIRSWRQSACALKSQAPAQSSLSATLL